MRILSRWSFESIKKWLSYASTKFGANIFKIEVPGALNVTKNGEKTRRLISAGFFTIFRDIKGSCDFNFKDIGPKFGGGIAQPFLNRFKWSTA